MKNEWKFAFVVARRYALHDEVNLRFNVTFKIENILFKIMTNYVSVNIRIWKVENITIRTHKMKKSFFVRKSWQYTITADCLVSKRSARLAGINFCSIKLKKLWMNDDTHAHAFFFRAKHFFTDLNSVECDRRQKKT